MSDLTREEAKEILQGARITSFRPNGTERVKEALDLAIEALSQPIVCKDYCIDDDHIYCSPKVAERVVEALSSEAEPKWNCTANFAAEQLDRLRNMTDEERCDFFIRFVSPSAELNLQTPQTYGKSINPSNAEVVDDLISRADAMGAVQDHFNDNGFKGYDDGQKMMDRINALPSAVAIDGDLISRQVLMDRLESFCKWCKDGRLQGAEFVWDCIVPNVPSAKTTQGEWIFNTDENNGKSWNVCSVCGYSIFHTTNFCPSCGAIMFREDGEA